jgi:hypothetical protein
LFRWRVIVVVVLVLVLVEDGLGEHAHKKRFSHKKIISLLDNNKG